MTAERVPTPSSVKMFHVWPVTLTCMFGPPNIFRGASSLTQLWAIWTLLWPFSVYCIYSYRIKRYFSANRPQILRQLSHSRCLLSNFWAAWLHCELGLQCATMPSLHLPISTLALQIVLEAYLASQHCKRQTRFFSFTESLGRIRSLPILYNLWNNSRHLHRQEGMPHSQSEKHEHKASQNSTARPNLKKNNKIQPTT